MRHRFIALPALFTSLLLTPALARAEDHDCMVDVSEMQARADTADSSGVTDVRDDDWEDDAETPGATAGRVTVYLNRRRTTLRAGWDDSARNVSALVAARRGRSLQVPGWRGSDRAWRGVVSCVKKGLAAFDVDVVTERPRTGRYIMAMIGGRSSLLAMPRSASGIAPYSGRVIDDAVVFVFARNLRHRIGPTCQTALHEVAHALGLDHSYDCRDLMSYRRCGTKRFLDRAASCGEFRRRRCGDGGRSQNSYRRLVAALGLRNQRPRSSQRPEPRVARRPARPRPPPKMPVADQKAPSVQVVSLRTSESTSGDNHVQIVVRARDAGGVASVELAWASPRGNYVFRCGAIERSMPVRCRRQGDRFIYTLDVGVGPRAFAVRVSDKSGNYTVTSSVSLHFRGPEWEPAW